MLHWPNLPILPNTFYSKSSCSIFFHQSRFANKCTPTGEKWFYLIIQLCAKSDNPLNSWAYLIMGKMLINIRNMNLRLMSVLLFNKVNWHVYCNIVKIGGQSGCLGSDLASLIGSYFYFTSSSFSFFNYESR